VDDPLHDALIRIERALCDNAGNRLTKALITGLFSEITEALGVALKARADAPPAPGATLVGSGTFEPTDAKYPS
jgi:hypothetical protein